MRTTEQQRTAAASLQALAAGQYRVITDPEGWPMIPGRPGQIEFHDGRSLAVFTDRRRMHSRILAVPNVQRHQTGDEELRALFPPSALSAVASAVKARRKRALSPSSLQSLARARATTMFARKETAHA